MGLISNNSLLKHSGIIFSSAVVGGIFGYLFQLYVGRALGPVGYGEFSALVSLLYITSVPAGTIGATITRFTSEYRAKSEYGKIKYLLIYSIKKLLVFGIAGFLLIGIFSTAIASFLNIPSFIPILIIGLIFIVSAIYPIATGMLIGLQKFTQVGLNGILGAVFKLLFGILFVYIGMGVNGAILALFMSPFIAFLLALVPMRFILKETSVKIKKRDILQYSFPVFMTMLIITLISNIDVMLVKHYFSAEDAGYYSAASLISKIIFFISGSIATVMFPKVSELYIKKENTTFVLKSSLFYTGLISSLIVLTYWMVPTFVISMLFGREFIETTKIIGLFGTAFMFFSLSYILIMYNLAVKNFRFIYFSTFVLILEILIFSMYHDTLQTVVKILFILYMLLFTLMSLDIVNRNNTNKSSRPKISSIKE